MKSMGCKDKEAEAKPVLTCSFYDLAIFFYNVGYMKDVKDGKNTNSGASHEVNGM
jgi:hypothetical protein